MNNTKIELKDLVWKETNIEEKLDKLEVEWYKKWDIIDKDISKAKYYFDNAEQIAKEKAEILNKQIEYTKDDIVEMFVEAGFVWENNKRCTYKIKQYTFNVEFSDEFQTVWFELDTLENYSKFNDRKSIEFYYNKFREILEFEVKNDN